MVKNKLGAGSILAMSVLGLGMAMPSFAQTGPELVLSDNAGDVITILAYGAPVFSGNCNTDAAHVCSTSSVSAAAGSGSVTWSGTIGGFFVDSLQGKTKPLLSPPAMDLGAVNGVQYVAGSLPSNGVLTVTWSDNGFTNGSGGSMSAAFSGSTNIVPGATISYAAYIDNGNNLLGTGSPVGSVSNTTTTVPVQGPGPTAATFAMTQVATFNVADGSFASTDFQFNVATSPITVTCPVASGTSGTNYSSGLTTSGAVGSVTYSVSGLPPGLSINASTGLVSGLPTVAGTYSYTVIATDSVGDTSTVSCPLTVGTPTTTGGSTPPSISLACPTKTTGQAGLFYTSSLVVTGGVKNYIFSETGSLDGLSLNTSTGVISGVPTNGGTITFTGKVTDGTKPTPLSATTPSSCTVTFAPPPSKLSFVCPTGTGTVGTAYNTTIQVTGGFSPYKFSITGLPAGLSYNSSTGAITGTPTSAGTFKLHVIVTDSSGNSVGNSCSSDCTIVIGCTVSGSISGYVYDDLNGSKTYNSGDKAFQGVTVTLKGSNGATVATATSNSSGYYSFSNLPAGNYTVVAPTTAVGSESLDTNSTIAVTVGGNSYSCTSVSSNNNFGYVGSSTVTGKCYTNDYWGGSHGMGGQTITVSGKDCYGNNVKKTCNTDNNGNYSCSGLYPGSYTVSAPSSCNWSGGYHSIQTSSNINVGCQSNDYHANLNFCYNYGW